MKRTTVFVAQPSLSKVPIAIPLEEGSQVDLNIRGYRKTATVNKIRERGGIDFLVEDTGELYQEVPNSTGKVFIDAYLD